MKYRKGVTKSIADAAWYRFKEWLEYFGGIYGVPVLAVEPTYSSFLSYEIHILTILG
ncbi:MAG: hypothetical protein WBA93_16565 [Microcoleaceae cyanobacterium]